MYVYDVIMYIILLCNSLLFTVMFLKFFFFFFNDTATTEIYTLSLHDALPISRFSSSATMKGLLTGSWPMGKFRSRDRKSTRLNSSHGYISYAVFCLKKKKMKLSLFTNEVNCIIISMTPYAVNYGLPHIMASFD